MRPAYVALTLLFIACAPVTGAGDSAPPVDAADVLDTGPDAEPARDALVDESAPEASMPDAPVDAPPPDTLTCTTDMDRDGRIAASCGGDDCDDDSRTVFPGRPPSCGLARGADWNCNGVGDETESETDRSQRCVEEWPQALAPFANSGGTPVPTAPPQCRTSSTGTAFRCRVCWRESSETRCACWSSGLGQRASRCD